MMNVDVKVKFKVMNRNKYRQSLCSLSELHCTVEYLTSLTFSVNPKFRFCEPILMPLIANFQKLGQNLSLCWKGTNWNHH